MVATLLTLLLVAKSPDQGPAQPVPFTKVQIADRFWSLRQEINRTASVQHCLDELKSTGDLHNFELAIEGAHAGRIGFVFQDSDTYKVIQGAADTLATHPDPALDKRLDEIIALIAKAQMPDGYIDTYYQVTEPGRRFTNLRDNHELYCAGHLIEAAVAHYKATGKHNLLDVATKYANLLYTRYGPESGRLGYGGHPELELALVKLSRATNDPRYFALAQKLVMTRGTHFFAREHQTPDAEYDGTYWIDDVPITQHNEIKGHAVRAAYLMSGATDVEMQTENPALAMMLDRVWRNAVEKRIFVTGGIGPSGSNEGFTVDYDLPNETAYQETCASIAMAMWGYRMGLLHADARYFDTVENSLYNAMLAGVALDGKHFNYTNPLASSGSHHRQPWFDCACCPPNALRTIAELGGYAYAQRGDTVFVNLYLPGTAEIKIGDQPVKLTVQGNYPWDGHLTIRPVIGERDGSPAVRGNPRRGLLAHRGAPRGSGNPLGRADGALSDAVATYASRAVSDSPPPWVPPRGRGTVRSVHMCLRLRIPGWCHSATLKLNGRTVNAQEQDGYLAIDRTWNPGDSVELDLPMPVEKVEANPRVKEDAGRLAIRRGPLIYCEEAVDQTAPVHDIVLPREATLKPSWQGDLMGGIEVLTGTGESVPEDDWAHRLYQPAPTASSVQVQLVPYCDWDNRKPGAMEVWLPSVPAPARVGGPEVRAQLETSFQNSNANVEGINDGSEPASSSQGDAQLMHWWPHKGTQEWVSYRWTKPIRAKGIRLYFFDDTGSGECRLPASWRLERLEGDNWVPVDATYPVERDKWVEVDFPSIQTQGLRLVVQLKPGWAAGVRQWRVIEDDER